VRGGVRLRHHGADPVIVDLSADFRSIPAWYYGLPELTRGAYAGQRRISNPGCYATAMQLALAPMRDVLDGPAQCFGVSGYSGAGTTPSDKNDPEQLRDNLMPYALTNHVHEREVSAHLNHPVEFLPHVAPHFRGLTITANMHLSRAFDREAVMARYREHYAGEPLVRIVDAAPWVSRIAGAQHVELGGFTLSVDGRRLVAVAPKTICSRAPRRRRCRTSTWRSASTNSPAFPSARARRRHERPVVAEAGRHRRRTDPGLPGGGRRGPRPRILPA
jgi:N-acetyl-gamma-glutamyl-phosphate reductase